MAKTRAFWPILRIPESAKLQIFVIFDYFGLPKIFQNGQNKGLLAYFADSGKRKIADFHDFDHFGLPKISKMAKIRACWPILRIPESAKLQIFVIFDHFGVSKNLQNGQNKGF